MMASLVASTIAFFAASYFIKRWADEQDLPKGMVRSLAVFALALIVSYAVGWLVDHVA